MYSVVCPFSRIGSPRPLSRKRVCPPQEPKGGGATFSGGWREGGEPVRTTGEKAWHSDTLWTYNIYCNICWLHVGLLPTPEKDDIHICFISHYSWIPARHSWDSSDVFSGFHDVQKSIQSLMRLCDFVDTFGETINTRNSRCNRSFLNFCHTITYIYFPIQLCMKNL
jgi:hypothetical protein